MVHDSVRQWAETFRMRVLILGCGYVGLEAGRQLVAAGHSVVGVCRSGERSELLRAAGIVPEVGDLTRRSDLDRLVGPFHGVINTVSSSRGGAAEYRSVYLEGTRTVIGWLREVGVQRYAYTSSTSVYAQTDGSWVGESDAAQPAGETGGLLRETEELLLAASRDWAFPAVILRVAGIYGPERGFLFQKFLAGEATLSGDGRRFINMIHRDDVASALVRVLDPAVPPGIYNCADDEPVSQAEFLRWAAQELDRAMPPSAPEPQPGTRKRGVSHKRVSNARLRGVGWTPRFPSWREGYRAWVEAIRAGRSPEGSSQPSATEA
jgi:nucleoside-diphosphate-sugar epimerase